MPKNPGEGLYQTWISRIQDALKREKTFRQKGQKVVDLYEAKKPDETPFAIVYSNAEVLIPAVYNSRPIPLVTRRFRDADRFDHIAPDGDAAHVGATRWESPLTVEVHQPVEVAISVLDALDASGISGCNAAIGAAVASGRQIVTDAV